MIVDCHLLRSQQQVSDALPQEQLAGYNISDIYTISIHFMRTLLLCFNIVLARSEKISVFSKYAIFMPFLLQQLLKYCIFVFLAV